MGAVREAHVKRIQPWYRLCRFSAMNRTARALLIIVLVILLIGLLPAWPYSSGWGWYPTGGLGLLLMIVIALVLLEKM